MTSVLINSKLLYYIFRGILHLLLILTLILLFNLFQLVILYGLVDSEKKMAKIFGAGQMGQPGASLTGEKGSRMITRELKTMS